MRERTVCFTGHRKLPLLKLHAIKKRLYEELSRLIEDGYCYFGAGGALGFDTLAAQAVLALKKGLSKHKADPCTPVFDAGRSVE